MRRQDREVKDFFEIVRIIDACEIVRLGLADGDYPYIVPVNFAYKAANRAITLYIHGASAGRKYQLLQQNPVCSFEMDIPLKIDCIHDTKEVTMRYKCVMGKATVKFLNGKDKQAAIDDIMARYKETRCFQYNKNAVELTSVAELTVTEITAKVNPIRDQTIFE